MTDSRPKARKIARLFDAVYPSFAMLAGMELELFTPLSGRALAAEELATALGVQAGKLRPLLYALVVAGLLTVEDGRFTNTAEADHFLVRGRPAYLGGLWQLTAGNWRGLLDTATTIRAGSPVSEYDYHELAQEDLAAIFRGLYPGAVRDAGQLMAHLDLSSGRRLLDVGGGSGGLAITLAQALPDLEATILDLPLVTPITRQFVAESGVADRVNILTGDAVHGVVPGRYDLIVARHLLQVLSAADNRALLGNLAAALEPGGLIVVVGWILDDSRLSPPATVGYNLILLTAYQDGQAYTEGEYRHWLAEAGLAGFERLVLGNGTSIIRAHKPTGTGAG